MIRAERILQRIDALNLPVSVLNSNSTKCFSLCFDFEFVRCEAIGLAFAIWVTYNWIRFCSHFFRWFFSPVNNCRFAHIRIDKLQKKSACRGQEAIKNKSTKNPTREYVFEVDARPHAHYVKAMNDIYQKRPIDE